MLQSLMSLAKRKTPERGRTPPQQGQTILMGLGHHACSAYVIPRHELIRHSTVA
jgi:hypothetical protein